MTRFFWIAYAWFRGIPLLGGLVRRVKSRLKPILFPGGLEAGLFARGASDVPAFFPRVRKPPRDPLVEKVLKEVPGAHQTPAPPLDPLNDKVRFSVVICTLNRAASLAVVLDALTHQRHPDFEVIVVVGPCTDDTLQMLASWRDRVRVESCPEANLSVSRNIGIAASAGEVVCFIDDDAIPEPNWLDALERAYAGSRWAGVGGMIRDHTGVDFQMRGLIMDRLARHTPIADSDLAGFRQSAGGGRFPSTTGCNSSFRRDALHAIGGFDEHYAYLLDESDVNLRMMDGGYQQTFAFDAEVHHKYAASDIRDEARVPKSHFVSSRSLAYFCVMNGLRTLGPNAVRKRLDEYRNHHARYAAWLLERRTITSATFERLLAELDGGLREGALCAARSKGERKLLVAPAGDVSLFRPFRIPTSGGWPLRLTLISQENPATATNGIATWTRLLANSIAKAGHEVSVICRAAGPHTVDYVDGVWIHATPDAQPPRFHEVGPLNLPREIGNHTWAVAQEARRIAEIRGVDVISGPVWDVEPIELVLAPIAPVCVSLHTTYAISLPYKPEWRADEHFQHAFLDKVIEAERVLLAGSAHLLANSQTIIAAIEANYGLEGLAVRASVVPHGIEDLAQTAFVPAPDPLGRQRVVYFGRMEPRKGADLMLAAIPHLLARGGDVEVVLVGADNIPVDHAGTTLRTQAESTPEFQLIAERVRFAGIVDQAELIGWLHSADVVALPSRFESFGLVFVEAACLSKAVVGLDIAALRELLGGDDPAAVFAPDTPEGFADAIAKLLSDPGERERLGRLARERFESSFTVDKMRDGALAVYREMARTSD